jgi:cobalamin biosynthesis protein CobT
MGGSFESGAGDDPNDLFASDEDNNEETEAGQSEETQEAESEVKTSSESDNGGNTATGGDTTTDQTSQTSEPDTRIMLDIESGTEIDAARLAREFVPDTYDKPHAWALGRDGVNDGRAEKKTFFLQSSVLDLEAACSQEVNEILDGDVPLTDLRELALILAYHQPELLAEAARKWGAESA